MIALLDVSVLLALSVSGGREDGKAGNLSMRRCMFGEDLVVIEHVGGAR